MLEETTSSRDEKGAPNPRLISFARRRRGLTKTELAKKVSLDLRTITAYESGEKSPTTSSLARLQIALDFPVDFFFGDDIAVPPQDGVSFRSLSRMTARQRDMAEGQGAIAMRLAGWIDKRFELPAVNIPDLRHQIGNPESAAETLRRLWVLGELPVRNMVHLLEANGVRVFSLSIDAKEVDAFSWWDDNAPIVMLNGFKSSEHSRFDVAHELGHLVLHRHAGASRSREAEHQADAFASAFLMPEGSVRGYANRFPTVDSLIKMKHIWGVSVGALNYRLHKIDLTSDWHYRSLCIEIARRGFRTQEPEEQERESSVVLQKIMASVYREDGLSRSGLARELQISPSELDGLLFGLTLTALDGSRIGSTPSKKSSGLRVVK